MADRYAFQSPFARGDGSEPWFRIGDFGVNTTTAITALGIISYFVRAIETGSGTILEALELNTDKVASGHLWRIVSWPIPNEPQIWPLLTLIFFFLIGNQFESLLGRRAYTVLIGALMVIPPVVAVLVSIALSADWVFFGVRFLFLGLIAGFSVAFPQARSFFNIPFWVLSAAIFALDFLSILGDRDAFGRGVWVYLAMLMSTGVVGLVLTRSLGYAEDADWIPTVPIPSNLTGQTTTTGRSSRRRRRPRKNQAGLRAVPNRTASDAEIDALLDQVNEQGLGSLTKQQKATLERHAQEMRRKRGEA